jgi:hypothetical protein
VALVLNTSLNNRHEPITNPLEEMVALLITSELDMLLIGNLLVRKKQSEADDWLGSCFRKLPHVEIRITAEGFYLVDRHREDRRRSVSINAVSYLSTVTRLRKVISDVQTLPVKERSRLAAEFKMLVADRLIDLA